MKIKWLIFTGLVIIAVFYAYAWRDSSLSDNHPDYLASKECMEIRKTISQDVKNGSDEQTILRFYEHYKWPRSYDKRAHAYTSKIDIKRENGVTAHAVMVRVVLDKDDRVKTINVTDSYLAP